MGREIQAFAMGTYYKSRSPNASDDASDIRGLVYHAKANNPDIRPQVVRHPACGHKKLETPDDAYTFVADAFEAKMPKLLELLGADAANLALVPIPSSEATEDSLDHCRWPALRIAVKLAERGIGKVRVAVVQKKKTKPQRGAGARELLGNLELLPRRWRVKKTIVYVDDLITWGAHIAAVDHLLDQPRGAAAFAIGFTDGTTYATCTRFRRRLIRYDDLDAIEIVNPPKRK